jgi:septal ring factor EnvC (AmiA/AmiB activator)
MMLRPCLLGLGPVLAGLVFWLALLPALAQDAPYQSAAEAVDALRQTERALIESRARGDRLEAEARRASAAADRTASAAAAVAARIQQSEAEIQLAQVRVAEIDRQRKELRSAIAARQEPVVRLTAALEMISRRPLVFSLMRAESLRDTVYLRAVLETMVPQVRRSTSGLRSQIMRGRQLQDRAREAQAQLRESEVGLLARRQELAGIESRQRIESRSARGSASREGDRVIGLAEETRDLTSLMARLREDASLRARLAVLPGPVARPSRPGAMLALESTIEPSIGPVAFSWILPVSGRVVTGFGAASGGSNAQGITFAPSSAAQVIAPAAGRIAFASAYRGYGRVVIIEHDGGWSSLITNMGRLDVEVGARVVQGSPLGLAGVGRPIMSVELRKDGVAVNPLSLLPG